MRKKSYLRYIFVADIGSTNSHIGIMGVNNNKSFDIILRLTYLTKELRNFPEIINNSLKYAKENHKLEVKIGCIVVAGPISGKRGYVKLTNVDLEINQEEILSKTMLTKVILINDYEAMGFGIDMLDFEKDVVRLPHVGEDLTAGMSECGTVAVIGARSSFGMVIAHYDSVKHLHIPIHSEGSHMAIAPSSELECKLITYLKKKVLSKKDVSPEWERVLSVQGIENIFNFLITQKGHTKTNIVKNIKKMEGIIKLSEIEANYTKDKLCKQTIDMFIELYARACSNLALVSECYSGLFISDIIALKNINNLEIKKKILISFMKEFEKHDIRSDVLKKVPVFLITNKDVVLYGCCNVAINFSNLT